MNTLIKTLVLATALSLPLSTVAVSQTMTATHMQLMNVLKIELLAYNISADGIVSLSDEELLVLNAAMSDQDHNSGAKAKLARQILENGQDY